MALRQLVKHIVAQGRQRGLNIGLGQRTRVLYVGGQLLCRHGWLFEDACKVALLARPLRVFNRLYFVFYAHKISRCLFEYFEYKVTYFQLNKRKKAALMLNNKEK